MDTATSTVNGLNVSFVEFGGANASKLGDYLQTDASNWTERASSGERRFVFQQAARDEWSVYLFDQSRNVAIQLDLYRKKVQYGTGDGPKQDLYEITGGAAIPPAMVFAALVEFNQWYASGGEHRAALPANSMLPLNTIVVDLRSRIRQIVHDLEGMQISWGRLLQAESDTLASVMFKKFAGDLLGMKGQADVLVQQATLGRNQVVSDSSLMQAHIEDDRLQIQNSTIALEDAKRRQEQARRDLQDAKNQLEGDQGFLNGFLTGISLGIHNPVKENIDKANQAVASINSEIANQNFQVAQLQKSSEELAEGQVTMKHLSSLDAALTQYQNQVGKAGSILSDGEADVSAAAKAASVRLGEYYKKRAGQEMMELFSWIESFRSAC